MHSIERVTRGGGCKSLLRMAHFHQQNTSCINAPNPLLHPPRRRRPSSRPPSRHRPCRTRGCVGAYPLAPRDRLRSAAPPSAAGETLLLLLAPPYYCTRPATPSRLCPRRSRQQPADGDENRGSSALARLFAECRPRPSREHPIALAHSSSSSL